MSSDDIFAAQFWLWPDPAIKRNAQGHVLFVNAAFLALYGGTVEAWHGNIVGGWSAPQAPVGGVSQPHRFEARVPTATGEEIYDWVEQILSDGHAFALARNVTKFVGVPSAAAAPTLQAPPMQASDVQAPAVQDFLAQTPATPPATQMASESFIADNVAPAALTAAVAAPAASLAADAFAPATDSTPPLTDVSTLQASSPSVPEVSAPVTSAIEEFAAEVTPPAPVVSDLDQAAPATEAPVTQDLAEPDQDEAPREFERRALPIEDEDSVLGSNWRDAVIAKAVGSPEGGAEAPEEAANEVPAPVASDSQSIRILLAEDNAINALLTRTLLEADGHSVETVEDGSLAVEAMKTSAYDLIFMDMRMPNMDGLEATRKIRQLPNISSKLPIIALTANAFDDDRNACFDSGMNDFMTKPVSAEELSEMVTTWTSPEALERLTG